MSSAIKQHGANINWGEWTQKKTINAVDATLLSFNKNPHEYPEDKNGIWKYDGEDEVRKRLNLLMDHMADRRLFSLAQRGKFYDLANYHVIPSEFATWCAALEFKLPPELSRLIDSARAQKIGAEARNFSVEKFEEELQASPEQAKIGKHNALGFRNYYTVSEVVTEVAKNSRDIIGELHVFIRNLQARITKALTVGELLPYESAADGCADGIIWVTGVSINEWLEKHEPKIKYRFGIPHQSIKLSPEQKTDTSPAPPDYVRVTWKRILVDLWPTILLENNGVRPKASMVIQLMRKLDTTGTIIPGSNSDDFEWLSDNDSKRRSVTKKTLENTISELIKSHVLPTSEENSRLEKKTPG